MKLKAEFKKTCEENNGIPLFQRYSWFEANYEADEWDVCISMKGERVMGVFPYVVQRKRGFKVIVSQNLAPYQGVWINYPENLNKIKKISLEKEVINDLINQLPKFDLFRLKFGVDFNN